MKICFKILLLHVVLLLAISCEKKVVEIVPVLQVQKDMSIPGAGAIKFFNFPSPQVGYAASDTSFIYKTINAGSTWSRIDLPGNKTCKGIEFYDEETGLVMAGSSVYLTEDGGDTWIPRNWGSFLGMTESGIGVVGDFDFFTCDIRVTYDRGQSFQYYGTINNIDGLGIARVEGNTLVVVPEDQNSGSAKGYNFETGEPYNAFLSGLTFAEVPKDIHLSEENEVIVGTQGLVMNGYTDRFYDGNAGHKYTLHSVDGYGDLVIIVGQNTIMANIDLGLDRSWNQIFDKTGNGFTQTFFKVSFTESGSFYLSGTDGLLYLATI